MDWKLSHEHHTTEVIENREKRYVCRRISQEDNEAESPSLKLRCNYAREEHDGSCSWLFEWSF